MKRKLKPLEYALWLLKSRDRSIGEMREKFVKRQYSPEEIEQTLSFLIEKNFLDDQRFAENFVRFKKNIKPVGRYYLRNKLMEKKISSDLIDKVLKENTDKESEIIAAAKHWMQKNSQLPREKIYEKLSRHLLSRGFGWEKVREIVDQQIKKLPN